MKSNQPSVPIVRVVFHTEPDFIYSVEQWELSGGYKAFLKDNCISISSIKQVKYGQFMPFNKFHTLQPWEG